MNRLKYQHYENTLKINIEFVKKNLGTVAKINKKN